MVYVTKQEDFKWWLCLTDNINLCTSIKTRLSHTIHRYSNMFWSSDHPQGVVHQPSTHKTQLYYEKDSNFLVLKMVDIILFVVEVCVVFVHIVGISQQWRITSIHTKRMASVYVLVDGMTVLLTWTLVIRIIWANSAHIFTKNFMISTILRAKKF